MLPNKLTKKIQIIIKQILFSNNVTGQSVFCSDNEHNRKFNWLLNDSDVWWVNMNPKHLKKVCSNQRKQIWYNIKATIR